MTRERRKSHHANLILIGHKMTVNSEKKSVLIVDDIPENLSLFEQTLENLDCTIYRATSGQEAVDMTIENDGFDLILLDIYMPGLNGYRVAELIRKTQKFKSIPIVFITANHTDERDVARGYEVGAVDYLTKPVDLEVLLNKVQSLLAINK